MSTENNEAPETKPTEDIVESPETVEEFPEELRDIDPTKLDELRNIVARFSEGTGKTESGSEAPVDAPTAVEKDPRAGATMTGADVDWSEYDLEFNLRHLYPRATVRETPEGPKWVVMLEEFFTTSRNWDSHGSRTKKNNEPLNLGEYLGDMVNSPEGWRPITFLPDSYGRAGVLLHRQVPLVLPDPRLLEKATEVEAPRDPELQKTEDDALRFMETEGLTPEVSSGDTQGGESRSALEAVALALNPPTERDPAGIPRGTITAPVEELREDVMRARDGEDFGEVK